MCVAVSIGLAGPQSVAQIMYTLSVDREQVEFVGGAKETRFWVSSDIGADYDTYGRIGIASGDGSHSYVREISSSHGESSLHSTFEALIGSLSGASWQLTTHLGEPSQEVFEFQFDVSGFSAADIPGVSILNPTGLSSFLGGSSPTYTWVGPSSGYDTLSVVASDLDGGSIYHEYSGLDVNATMWTAGNPIPASSETYYFHITYEKPESSLIAISSLTRVSDATPFSEGWSTSIVLRTGASTDFVVVPEPRNTVFGFGVLLLGVGVYRFKVRR